MKINVKLLFSPEQEHANTLVYKYGLKGGGREGGCGWSSLIWNLTDLILHQTQEAEKNNGVYSLNKIVYLLKKILSQKYSCITLISRLSLVAAHNSDI